MEFGCYDCHMDYDDQGLKWNEANELKMVCTKCKRELHKVKEKCPTCGFEFIDDAPLDYCAQCGECLYESK